MAPLPKLVVPRASFIGAFLAVAIPGLGHWWIGRAARGLLCFVAATAGLNLIAVSSLVRDGRDADLLVYGGAPLLLGSWIYSAVDGVRTAFFARSGRARARRAEDLTLGAALLESGDLRGARSAFARAASDDAYDAAALLGLARSERLLGEPKRAAAHARRALRAGAPARYREALRAEIAAAKTAARDEGATPTT